MSKTKFLSLFALYTICMSTSLSAMVFDNRFFPLFTRPRLLIEGLPSEFATDVFFTTASSAFDSNEDEIGIPELHGMFDQGKLGESFVRTGRPNPLRTEWHGSTIPWQIEGKIQSQGVTFSYQQALNRWLTFGASWAFFRINSSHTFRLKRNDADKEKTNLFLKAGDETELDRVRREMFTALGITALHANQVGFGDIDAYLRIGTNWNYTFKFRHIDAGLRAGMLAPTGLTRDQNNPASVPVGGNGHWGMYVAGDCLFELKEDLKAGILLRVNKRFTRTKCRRMPACQEPRIFGTIVGNARINPGPTVILSPYFFFENLRRGLGAGVQYTLTKHWKDTWCDDRLNPKTPALLTQVNDRSTWGSSYFTINVLYDFGKMEIKRELDPIVWFRWDVPAMLFVTKNVAKTHKILLGLSLSY